MAAEIIVRGEGEARAMPDWATVRIGIDGEASRRDAAYAIAAERAAAVDRILGEYADAIARSITASVVVQPTQRYHKGEMQRTGWVATRSSVVTLHELDRIDGFIAALGEASATVLGPTWELSAHHTVYDEARRDAARDARARAEAYADALGVQLGPLTWAAEPGLRHGSNAGGGVFRAAPMAMAMRASGAVDSPEITVTADEISVTAALEVGYTIVS